MDAKTACDKLNGFNFQNRYLVGWSFFVFVCFSSRIREADGSWEQYYTTNPKRWLAQKETYRSARRT